MNGFLSLSLFQFSLVLFLYFSPPINHVGPIIVFASGICFLAALFLHSTQPYYTTSVNTCLTDLVQCCICVCFCIGIGIFFLLRMYFPTVFVFVFVFLPFLCFFRSLSTQPYNSYHLHEHTILFLMWSFKNIMF